MRYNHSHAKAITFDELGEKIFHCCFLNISWSAFTFMVILGKINETKFQNNGK